MGYQSWQTARLWWLQIRQAWCCRTRHIELPEDPLRDSAQEHRESGAHLRARYLCYFVLYSLYSCDFPSTLATSSFGMFWVRQVQLEESTEGMKVRGLGDAVPIRAGAPWVFKQIFRCIFWFAIERLVGVLRIFFLYNLYIVKRIWIIRSQGQQWIRFHMIPPISRCWFICLLLMSIHVYNVNPGLINPKRLLNCGDTI